MAEFLDSFAIPSIPARPDDRWLYPWGLAYAAVGAASLLVPLYGMALGGDALLVGLLAATGAVAGVPGGIAAGRVATEPSNRWPALASSLAAILLSLAALPLLVDPWLLVVPNAVIWLAVAVATPVLNLTVVENRPEPQWTERISRLNAAQGYGWVGGLLAGAGWTNALGGDPVFVQRTFFALSAATVLVAAGLVWAWYPCREGPFLSLRALREAATNPDGVVQYHTANSPYGIQRAYWRLSARLRRTMRPRNHALGIYLAAVFCFFAGFAVVFGPLPAYLVHIGLTSDEVFLLFVAASGSTAVFYAWTGSLIRRGSTSRAHASALVVRGVALPAVPLAVTLTDSLAALLVVFAVIGAAWSVIVVTATELVGRLSAVDRRGQAFGAFTALSGLGTAIGSAVGGTLAVRVGYGAMFLLAVAVVVLGAGLSLLAWRRNRAPL